MEENYYEILEVNKNASPEIIEKAYKTLVKKYHPDLQEDNLKNIYEEKIKKINEAYDILSNSEKRKNYDLNLNNTIISSDDYNNLINENINLKKEINYLKNNLNNIQKNINNDYNNSNNKNNYNSTEHMNNNSCDNYHNTQHMNNNSYNNYNKNQENINNAYAKAYYDAYIQDLKNRGYKIKYKKTWKDFVAFILTVLVIIFVGFILWQIPFTRKFLISLYEENPIVNLFINFILNIFK